MPNVNLRMLVPSPSGILQHIKRASGLHKLKFFIHEIPCTQNRFSCTSVHVGNRERKRVDVHLTNNNMYSSRNCTKLVLKLLPAKNGHSL